ncbi:four helix bundle protein [Salinimicrobium catena]|uniref:Four helix bundle protein n=1 Tax=Salinimicrobium catena TaxID=390640 RepID=A0A1H5PCZ8_9FLAO|nr:four helix bundle protein [Salinimicrobium catena]SDL79708.1 four helix bundle protein [Salinimicrobium catena]SEF11775.1 four helix bundle protein [Salinimicrobium catena]
MKSHQDLTVYQKSLDLVEEIYKLTQTFPSEEKFGVTSQLRRAAVSVPSNIAEGAARKGSKEFSRFLYISLGSLAEIETLLTISTRLQFLKESPTLKEEVIYIRRMLLKLIKTLD